MRPIGFAPAPAPPPSPPPNFNFADFMKAAEDMTMAYNAEKNAKGAAKAPAGKPIAGFGFAN